MQKSILLALFILLHISNYAQSIREKVTSLTSEKIQHMPDGFKISIALLHHDEIEYISLIKDNDVLQVTDLKDSLFEIGSLTKVFTSTVLASEILDKNISLQDKINASFSFDFNDNLEFNYLSLSNHTAGLYRLPANVLPFLFKNPKNPYCDYTKELFDNYLKEEIHLENQDKMKYSYSNLGAGLLAYALANRRNISFDKLLKMTVLDKYNMSSTSYSDSTSIKGIDAYNEEAENWQFNALKGAGGLTSSVSDLSKFVSAHFNSTHSELTLTRKETFKISQKMSIGLGWHILEPFSINKKYWHNGGTGGFTSSISFSVNNKTGIIILANISSLHSNSYLIDELCFELLDILDHKN